MTTPDPDAHSRELAAQALAANDPTGWFERLYRQADDGTATVPWDRPAPHQLLAEWAKDRGLDGRGRRALVVGFGLGQDSEFVAGLGFDTVAFDVSATAVRMTRERFPDSAVHYTTANLLEPPQEWRGAFDFVVESLTVQSLPVELHRQAIVHVGQFVAPGGTLLVIAGIAQAGGDGTGPPWRLTREEIDAFGSGGLVGVRVEEETSPWWRAEFHRPASGT